MTTWWNGQELASRIQGAVPGAVEEADGTSVWVKPETWHQVARFLKEDPGLDFGYLNSVTAVDFIEYFDVVYHLTSLAHNHACVVKARLWGRENLSLPSVVDLWQGADLQEREVYDLMGVVFTGHPSLKRVLLWEGFPGHPLRKDYEEAPLPYTWSHGG